MKPQEKESTQHVWMNGFYVLNFQLQMFHTQTFKTFILSVELSSVNTHKLKNPKPMIKPCKMRYNETLMSSMEEQGCCSGKY